jgi:hypothetical protein
VPHAQGEGLGLRVRRRHALRQCSDCCFCTGNLLPARRRGPPF